MSAGEQTDVKPTDAGGMASRIDELLDAKWREEGIQPAPRSDDAEFMRRVYLDLTGVIPTVAQARAFLSDQDVGKRSRLIDELLASPAHATHMATTWRNIMLPGGFGPQQVIDAARLQNWLRTQFADNMRYDRVVADFFLPGGDQIGPELFYTSQQLSPEKLGASTARVFLGLQIECAQCHDHPYDRWTQADFWGFAAFFARLRRLDDQRPSRPIQLVDSDQGEVMLPDSETVVQPKFPGVAMSEDAGGGTRRMELAVWMASRDNPYVAQAAVNRAWYHLFGRGLVEPVDDIGPHNSPSHPQLLEELAAFFVRTGFDMRELCRAVGNTKAYQLTSRTDAPSPSRPDFFARMAIKPLTAEQFYDSLNRSLVRRPSPTAPSDPTNNPLFDSDRQDFLAKMPSATRSATEYQSGILQGLTLINGDDIAAATDPAQSGLLRALEAPIFTDNQRIETLFLATLSRMPTSNERSLYLGHVQAADSDNNRRRALSDILWALLNSAEFAMNH